MQQWVCQFGAFGLLKQMVCGGVDIFKISGGGSGSTFIGVRVSKIKTFWNDCT
tara:strand:+ start:297 stop:455 length:159 start_codon:yes stop_codon:yes gene_type:complete